MVEAVDLPQHVDGVELAEIRAQGKDLGRGCKEIVQRIVTSGLIYLPSSVKDFASPAIEPYLRQYVRGSYGIDAEERVKIMKLLWDSIGTEFGGRHELYEMNYAGGWEDIRAQALTFAEKGGDLARMEAMVDQCMSDYDRDGWTGDTWLT